MDDIVAAARAHIESLPPHLKDRYSAKLICKLIAKVLLLQELREQDGKIIGIQLREYQKMQERCIDGDSLTAEEREAIEWAVETSDYYAGAGHRQATETADTLRKLVERMK